MKCWHGHYLGQGCPYCEGVLKDERGEYEDAMSRTISDLRSRLALAEDRAKTKEFDIGGSGWPGISKVIEECGELQQVCGKLLGTGGEVEHWDGSNLRDRLEEEIGDVMAACQFVMEKCPVDQAKVTDRIQKKLKSFRLWHEEDPREKEARRLGGIRKDG